MHATLHKPMLLHYLQPWGGGVYQAVCVCLKCMSVLLPCIYIYALHVCLVPKFNRMSDPWNWSCGWLETVYIWVLGIEPGSSTRASHALYH
ncbi:hypothetical protein LEMLEM_LOCUS1263 [Lemmus lemmus]